MTTEHENMERMETVVSTATSWGGMLQLGLGS